jgi:glycerophosphoryl diester phosphodiesterase
MSVTFLTNEDKAELDEKKVNVAQGADNVGTLLYVGADGKVANVGVGDDIEVVVKTSKNIVFGEWECASISATGVYIQQSIGRNWAAINKMFPVTPGGTYTASIAAFGGTTWLNLYVHEYDQSRNWVKENSGAKGTIYPTTKRTFTVSEQTAYIRFYLYCAEMAFEDVIPEGMMIEPGAVKTEYEPHKADGLALSVKNKNAASESITDGAYAEHAPSATVRSIAHRGAPGNAPECTAHAYILAKKLGFTVAENDVARTSDGKYVMWHDTNLGKCSTVFSLDGKTLMADTSGNRYWASANVAYSYDETTGTYTKESVSASTLSIVNGSSLNIADQTFAFLRNIDVGKWKDSKFCGTQMLSFAEWLDLCKSLGMECYVDAKFTYTDEQAAELVSIARRKGMLRKCSWLSCMESVRKADPNARCGMLWAPGANNLSGNTENVFWNPPASDVTAENVAMVLDAGYGYECWYVDTASVGEEAYYAEIERLLQCGVQGLTLDDHTVEDFTAYKYGEAMQKY